MDGSASLVDQARKTAAREGVRVEFAVADAERLPCAGRRFDRIGCLYAIDHFPDLARALRGMLHRLTLDGKLVLFGPAEDNNAALYDHHLAGGGRVVEEMGHQVYEPAVWTLSRAWGLDTCRFHDANVVRFPDPEAFASYYETTKLFLDNVPPQDRKAHLDRFLAVARRRASGPIELVKSIAAFEVRRGSRRDRGSWPSPPWREGGWVLRGRASILGYEVPKHNRHFEPCAFFDVDEEDLRAKQEALQTYSEFTTRYSFEPDVIRSLARVRAMDAGHFGFCEALEVYRLIHRGAPMKVWDRPHDGAQSAV